MAIDILVPGADFSANPTGIICPINAGLIYFNLFCVPSIAPGRNLAPGSAGAVAYGNPVITAVPGQPVFTQFGPGVYIDTGVYDTDAITLLSIAGQVSDPSGDYVYPIGSYNGSGQGGANILGPATTAHNFTAGIGRSDQLEYVGSAVSTSFQFLSARAASGAATLFDNMTAAARTTGTDTNARQLSAATLKVGVPGNPTGVTCGPVNMVMAAAFARVIADAELTTFYHWMQQVLTKVGSNISI